MTKDKIQAARDSGYSDDEIAQYLSSSDEKFKKAIESGYSIDEVADYLALKEKPQQEAPAESAPTEPISKDQTQAATQEEGPSAGRIAAGLGAEIAVAEGLKYVGAYGGPIGYGIGATIGGAAASYLAQKIESPNKPISIGRLIADTGANFIPGKSLFKGAKATTKVGKALVGTGQVAARSALGAGFATGAQAVEKGIDEQRMLTEEELKQYIATGAALGGGLEVAGKAIKTFSPKLQELFKKSPEEIDNLVKAGDPETIKAVDEFYNRADINPEDLASTSDEEFVKKIIDRSEPTPKIDVEAKPKEPIAEIIERPIAEEIPTEVVDAGPQRQMASEPPKSDKQTIATQNEKASRKKAFYDRYLEEEVEVDKLDPRFESSRQQYVAPGGYINIVNQKNLFDVSGKKSVYHETNLKNIRSIVSGIKQGPRRSNLWVSDSEDLALGQSAKGYVLELDSELVNGTKTKSLSNTVLQAIDANAFEYNLTKTLPNSVLSIIVPNKKALKAIQETKGFDKIFDFDSIENTNGKFRIPARLKKTVSPEPTSEEIKPPIAGYKKAMGDIAPVILSQEDVSKNIQELAGEEFYPLAKRDKFIDIEVIQEKRKEDLIQKAAKETEYDIPEEPSIAKSISQLAQGFKSRFAPSLVAGGQTIAAEAKAAKAMAEAGRETGAILESKINRVVSKSKNPEEANRLAYEFINGKIDELPADLKSIEQDLLQGRKWIDEYQDVLLSNHYAGRRQLEEPLLREIERSKNDGDYLTKAYLFFESPAHNPSKQKRAALKAALIRNGTEAGDADVYLAQLDAKRAGGPDDVSNFVFQSPAGILKGRKELIPELRDYLGEVTQTGSRLAATMSKLSRIDAYDTADFNIKTGLKNLGIAVSKEDGIPQGYKELVLRRTPKLRPDQEPPADQLYVPEDVQRSINALYGADADNNAIDYTTRLIGDLFKTGGSLSSAVKTVFSPFSYTVQPLANMVLAFTAGGNPFKGLMRGGKYGLMQYKNIASRMGIDSVAEFKRRKELNIIGQGMIQGNLEAGLRGPKIGALVGKGVKPFGVAYSLTDSAFRNPVYENNLSFLNRVAPSSRSNVLSKKTEEIAASITNLTYPNYDYANTSLRTLSKYQALISAYATFPLEMFRTVYGQGKLAAKMIDGSFANFLEKQYGSVNREAIKNEGYARAARLIAALSMPMAGANLYSKTKGGVDKDEQEAVRESALPSYDEYTPTAMHKDKDGNYYITNMAYTFPQADIASVFVAGFREDDFPTALEKATKSLWSKVAGGNSFLIEPLFAAFGNYDPKRGEKISKEVDFLPNVLDRSMWFAEQAFKTGLQKEFEKATKAYNPTSAQELVMKAMGLRTKKVNPVEGVGFRLREITKDLNDIRSDYTSATYNIAGEDLENEYNKQNRIYQDNFKILSKHINNMYKMGFPREKVIQVMVDNGIGRANTLLAINGYTPSIPKVKEVTASTQWDRISQLAPKEQIDAIRKIEDRKMRERVFSLRKSDMIDKRRGITEEDKLWKSLEDRERISMAKDMMRQHSDPSAVLLGLLRKGKISKDNYREIKKQMP